jgi:hypothetical protein
LVSPQRIVARKSVVDNIGVQSADTTKLSLSRPSSAASSLSGGNTDLMSSPAQQVILKDSFQQYKVLKYFERVIVKTF